MSTQKRWFWCAAVLFAGLCPALALTGTPPVLTNAVQSGDQFQFTLRGQTNVTYIIESSSNLGVWTPALTNSDAHPNRTITVPAVPSAAFWRIRRPPAPLFSHAIAARGTVNLASSGVIDSFDSGDTNYSTGGQYDSAKRKAGGHIASGSATNVAVSIGNMDVAGGVSTEPGGTVTVGPVGCVGSLEWVSNPSTRGTIEQGYVRDDMNFAFAPARLPANFGVVPMFLPSGTYNVGGTNYKYLIALDGDYQALDISLGNGEKMLINARARLLVKGNTAVQGTGNIVLGPDASIEWYARGRVSMGGGGCINGSGLAQTFSIIGLTSQPMTYAATTRLIGTIYAPLAPVTLSGTTDAIGAVVCNSFSLSGTMGIHFDENLARIGPWR